VPLRIFISYRREDAAGHAGRLYDSLAKRFGPGNVFMDVDAIGLGSDFVQVIDGAVRQCDVLVALIGRRWLGAAGTDEGRRIDSPDDFVRVELESALANDVFIIPTAVDGAAFPTSAELPPSIEPLARRQGLELHDTSWHDDVKRLTRRLEAAIAVKNRETGAERRARPAHGRVRRRTWLVVSGVAILAAATAGIVYALVGGGSSGGTASNPAAEHRLLATIPAATRPSCRSISYGDPSALAAVACSGARVSVDYNLFPSADTMRGWYDLQREEARVDPGSGACTTASFRGEGSQPGGKHFCYVKEDGEAILFWTEAKTKVGAMADAYSDKGPAAYKSLLRQWRCCF
jgi:TIR domain-containing protein